MRLPPHIRVPRAAACGIPGRTRQNPSKRHSAASRNADRTKAAAGNALVITNGRMKVSTLPGLDLDQDFLKAARADGEPWW